MNFGYSLSFLSLDKGLIEKIGPTGFTANVLHSSSNVIGFNAGTIYNALFIILCFVLFFFIAFTLSF
jgi:hypothetical protein